MSTFKRKYLKFIENFITILFNITGLWPYTYNFKDKRFQLNLCYSLIPFIIVPYTVTIFILEADQMFSGINMMFKNVILKIISNVYVKSNIVNVCFIYLTQYFQLKRTKLLLYKARHVYEIFNGTFTLSDYNYFPILMKFTAKFMFLTILVAIAIFVSLVLISPSLSYISVIGLILPVFVIKILPDVFYGGMLLADFLFRIMNYKLQGIVNSAIEKSEFDSVLNKKFEMLSVMYVEVIEIVNVFHQIMSTRILFWLLLGVSNFIIQLFLQFVNISQQIRVGTLFNSTLSQYGVIILFAQSLEYWLTISVCSTLLKEFNRTQQILSSFQIEHSVKTKLGRSVILIRIREAIQ